jgi:hypothetical protein
MGERCLCASSPSWTTTLLDHSGWKVGWRIGGDLVLQRDGDREGASFSGRRVDGDRRLMCLDNPLRDGQPQTATSFLLAAGFIHSVESVEDLRQRLCRDTNAGITDLEANDVSFGYEGDED